MNQFGADERAGVVAGADAGTAPQTAAELLPIVYEQLRKLARQKLGVEPPGQTLQATSLVHEAYLRLVGTQASRGWESQCQFLMAAAESMRRILIDHARRRQCGKRGGGWQRVDFADLALVVTEGTIDLITLHESLSKLEQAHPEKAELVRLRYFAGLSAVESAAAMGISLATAERYWSFAKAWLLRHMSGGSGTAGGHAGPEQH